MTSTNRDVAHNINRSIGFNIACVFYFATADGKESDRLVVYLDNTNTVDIFDSLRAIPPYSRILILAITKVLDNHIDFHVLHICDINNSISDALSRYLNDL